MHRHVLSFWCLALCAVFAHGLELPTAAFFFNVSNDAMFFPSLSATGKGAGIVFDTAKVYERELPNLDAVGVTGGGSYPVGLVCSYSGNTLPPDGSFSALGYSINLQEGTLYSIHTTAETSTPQGEIGNFNRVHSAVCESAVLVVYVAGRNPTYRIRYYRGGNEQEITESTSIPSSTNVYGVTCMYNRLSDAFRRDFAIHTSSGIYRVDSNNLKVKNPEQPILSSYQLKGFSTRFYYVTTLDRPGELCIFQWNVPTNGGVASTDFETIGVDMLHECSSFPQLQSLPSVTESYKPEIIEYNGEILFFVPGYQMHSAADNLTFAMSCSSLGLRSYTAPFEQPQIDGEDRGSSFRRLAEQAPSYVPPWQPRVLPRAASLFTLAAPHVAEHLLPSIAITGAEYATMIPGHGWSLCFILHYTIGGGARKAATCLFDFVKDLAPGNVNSLVKYDSTAYFTIPWLANGYIMEPALVQNNMGEVSSLPPWLTCEFGAQFNCLVNGPLATPAVYKFKLCTGRVFVNLDKQLAATAPLNNGISMVFSANMCRNVSIEIASPQLHILKIPSTIGVLENGVAFGQLVLGNISPHFGLHLDITVHSPYPDIGIMKQSATPRKTLRNLELAPAPPEVVVQNNFNFQGTWKTELDVAVRNTLMNGIESIILTLHPQQFGGEPTNYTIRIKQEEAPVFIFASNPLRSQELVQGSTQIITAPAGTAAYEFYSVVSPSAAVLTVNVYDSNDAEVDLSSSSLQLQPRELQLEEFAPQTVFLSANFTKHSLWTNLATLEYVVVWTFYPNVTDGGTEAEVEQLNTTLTVELIPGRPDPSAAVITNLAVLQGGQWLMLPVAPVMNTLDVGALLEGNRGTMSLGIFLPGSSSVVNVRVGEMLGISVTTYDAKGFNPGVGNMGTLIPTCEGGAGQPPFQFTVEGATQPTVANAACTLGLYIDMVDIMTATGVTLDFITHPRLCPYRHSVSPAGTECIPCGENSASFGNTTSCTPCGSRIVSGDGSQCVSCSAGYGLSRSTCTKCSEGYYSEEGEMTCSACSAGRYSSYATASVLDSCSECASGRYSLPAAASCMQCPAGSYCSGGNIAPCPNGTYSETEWSACAPCAAGTYSKAGKECVACTPGTYSLNESSVCLECPSGRFSDEPKSSRCELCSAGWYSAAGSSRCLKCDPGYYSPEDSSQCFPCTAGTYAPSSGWPECLECSPGTYAGEDAASVCLRCPPGRVAAGWGNFECVACPLGFAPNSTETCKPCPAGTFVVSADDDDVETPTYDCTACPAGTWSPPESDACFVCDAGFYAPSGSSKCFPCKRGLVAEEPGASSCGPCADNSYADPSRSKCLPCPSNRAQRCEGGVQRFYPDFWTEADVSASGLVLTDELFHECEPGACAMTPEGVPQCAPQRYGRLCAMCEAGYFPIAGGGCAECIPDEAGIATFVLILITLLCLMAVMVATSNGKRSPFMSVSRVFINWMQAISTIGSFAYTVPSIVQDFLGFTSEADGLSLNSGFLKCVLPLDLFDTVYVYAALPLLAFVVPTIVVPLVLFTQRFIFRTTAETPDSKPPASPESTKQGAKGSTSDDNSQQNSEAAAPQLSRALGGSKLQRFTAKHTRIVNLVITTIVIFIFFVYLKVTKSLLAAFDVYRKPMMNGSHFMRQDLSLQAFTDAHVSAMVVAGIGVFTWTLGVPLTAILLIRRNRARLYQNSVLQKYGFLYTGYNLRRGLYFWELLVLSRKVFIAGLSVFNIEPFLQAYIASMFFILCLILHVHVRPYTSPVLNALEGLSLGSTVITQMGSILFTMYPDQETLLSILLLSVNIATILIFSVFLAISLGPLRRRIEKKDSLLGRLLRSLSEDGLIHSGSSPLSRSSYMEHYNSLDKEKFLARSRWSVALQETHSDVEDAKHASGAVSQLPLEEGEQPRSWVDNPLKQTPSEVSQDLPPGWIEQTTDDGFLYYENINTGVQQWDMPVDTE